MRRGVGACVCLLVHGIDSGHGGVLSYLQPLRYDAVVPLEMGRPLSQVHLPWTSQKNSRGFWTELPLISIPWIPFALQL